MKAHTPYSNFSQAAPQLKNEFTGDLFLQDYLRINLPEDMMNEIYPDLERFGKRSATELVELAIACENDPPKLINYNAWGERVDEILVSPGWKNTGKCL